jgi:hypothetical protein
MGTKMTHTSRAELTDVVRRRYCAATGAGEFSPKSTLADSIVRASPAKSDNDLVRRFVRFRSRVMRRTRVLMRRPISTSTRT